MSLYIAKCVCVCVYIVRLERFIQVNGELKREKKKHSKNEAKKEEDEAGRKKRGTFNFCYRYIAIFEVRNSDGEDSECRQQHDTHTHIHSHPQNVKFW